MRIFRASVDGGKREAKPWLAAIYSAQGKNDLAFKELSESAKDAQQTTALGDLVLGILFHNGQGIEKDDQAALRFFEAGASESSLCAAWAGTMYLKGLGAKKNEQRALELFQGSGEPNALEHLGDKALENNNPLYACQLYRAAGYKGSVTALVKFARMSMSGSTRNDDEAYFIAQVAAGMGSKEASTLVAQMKADAGGERQETRRQEFAHG
jgi:TPR repeat protein